MLWKLQLIKYFDFRDFFEIFTVFTNPKFELNCLFSAAERKNYEKQIFYGQNQFNFAVLKVFFEHIGFLGIAPKKSR